MGQLNVTIFLAEGFNAELLLEEERRRMRDQYEAEMSEIRQKMESEKQTKEKMQHEVELMKQQYEEKLKALEKSAKTGNLSRQSSIATGINRQHSTADLKNGKGPQQHATNEVQQAALLKYAYFGF